MPQTKAFESIPACLPSRPRHYPTIIRIMQLGRSYSRRLKSVNHEIYELCLSARYAYIPIGPAVKTSRPLNFLRRQESFCQFLWKQESQCINLLFSNHFIFLWLFINELFGVSTPLGAVGLSVVAFALQRASTKPQSLTQCTPTLKSFGGRSSQR